MIKAIDGPIGRCVDDCAIFMSALLDKSNYKNLSLEIADNFYEPKPFDFSKYNDSNPITFGYIE